MKHTNVVSSIAQNKKEKKKTFQHDTYENVCDEKYVKIKNWILIGFLKAHYNLT